MTIDAATKAGLDPIVDDASRLLILGTLPGDESLRLQRYYSHGRNQFWTILSRVYDEAVGSDYDERLTFLRRHDIALWDVLLSVDRRGSTDSAIKNPIPNDFTPFFAKYPHLRSIGLNGAKAEDYFLRLFAKQPGVPTSLRIARLPSSSPAAGRYVATLDEKVAQWKAFLMPTPQPAPR